MRRTLVALILLFSTVLLRSQQHDGEVKGASFTLSSGAGGYEQDVIDVYLCQDVQVGGKFENDASETLTTALRDALLRNPTSQYIIHAIDQETWAARSLDLQSFLDLDLVEKNTLDIREGIYYDEIVYVKTISPEILAGVALTKNQRTKVYRVRVKSSAQFPYGPSSHTIGGKTVKGFLLKDCDFVDGDNTDGRAEFAPYKLFTDGFPAVKEMKLKKNEGGQSTIQDITPFTTLSGQTSDPGKSVSAENPSYEIKISFGDGCSHDINEKLYLKVNATQVSPPSFGLNAIDATQQQILTCPDSVLFNSVGSSQGRLEMVSSDVGATYLKNINLETVRDNLRHHNNLQPYLYNSIQDAISGTPENRNNNQKENIYLSRTGSTSIWYGIAYDNCTTYGYYSFKANYPAVVDVDLAKCIDDIPSQSASFDLASEVTNFTNMGYTDVVYTGIQNPSSVQATGMQSVDFKAVWRPPSAQKGCDVGGHISLNALSKPGYTNSNSPVDATICGEIADDIEFAPTIVEKINIVGDYDIIGGATPLTADIQIHLLKTPTAAQAAVSNTGEVSTINPSDILDSSNGVVLASGVQEKNFGFVIGVVHKSHDLVCGVAQTFKVSKAPALDDLKIPDIMLCDIHPLSGVSNTYNVSQYKLDLLDINTSISDANISLYEKSDIDNPNNPHPHDRSSDTNSLEEADMVAYIHGVTNQCDAFYDFKIENIISASNNFPSSISSCVTNVTDNTADFDLSSILDVIASKYILSNIVKKSLIDRATGADLLAHGITSFTSVSTTLDFNFVVSNLGGETCSRSFSISLTTLASPILPPASMSEIVACDQSPASNLFDLTSKEKEFEDCCKDGTKPNAYIYFESLAEAQANINNGRYTPPATTETANQPLTNYKSYPMNTVGTKKVTVLLACNHNSPGGISQCVTPVELNLHLYAKETNNIPGLVSCVSSLGKATFNLKDKKNTIANADTSLSASDIEFYATQLEAEGSSQTAPVDISNNAKYISAETTIYVKYTSREGCINKFDLNIWKVPSSLPMAAQDICPAAYTNKTAFDLTTRESEAINGNSSHAIVTYYTTETDLQNEQNAIATPSAYEVTLTSKKSRDTIYVKVRDGACTYNRTLEFRANFPSGEIPDMESCENSFNSGYGEFDLDSFRTNLEATFNNKYNITIVDIDDHTKDYSNNSQYTSSDGTLGFNLETKPALGASNTCNYYYQIPVLVRSIPSIPARISDYTLCPIGDPLTSPNEAVFDINKQSRTILEDANLDPKFISPSVHYKDSRGNAIVQDINAYKTSGEVITAFIVSREAEHLLQCSSEERNFRLIVKNQGATNVLNYSECKSKNSQVVFNLSAYKQEIITASQRNPSTAITDANDIEIFETQLEAFREATNYNDISGQKSYQISSDKTIYARDSKNCSISEMNLSIVERPSAYKVGEVIVCDILTSSAKEVNLVNKVESRIIRTQIAANLEVSYYTSSTDATNANNPIPDPRRYTPNKFPSNVYVRVSSKEKQSCFATTSFRMRGIPSFRSGVEEGQNTFYECTNTFNLGDNISSRIQGTLPIEDYAMSFYVSRSDAQNQVSPIPASGLISLRRYEITRTTEIFVALTHKSSKCFNVESIILEYTPIVKPLEIIDMTLCSAKREAEFNLLEKKNEIIENQKSKGDEISSLSIFKTFGEAVDINNLKPDDISSQAAFSSSGEILYVRRDNHPCYVYPLPLIVYTAVHAIYPGELRVCSFDRLPRVRLSSKDNEILGIQDVDEVEVAYYSSREDAEKGLSSLPDGRSNNFYTPTALPSVIYARATNKVYDNCYDITAFTIVKRDPVISSPLGYPLRSCSGVFDLSVAATPPLLRNLNSNEYDVNYFSTENEAIQSLNPFPEEGENISVISYKITDLKTIYARVENKITGCFSTEKIELLNSNTETKIFIHKDTTLESCDYGRDGVEEFDLDEIKSLISDTPQVQDFEYFDAFPVSQNEDPIDSKYTSNQPRKDIFVRITDRATGCYDIGSFKLLIHKPPPLTSKSVTLLQCDTDRDFIELFNLNEGVKQMLPKEYLGKVQVSFFQTLSDARRNNLKAQVSSQFTNTKQRSQKLGIRFINDYGCLAYGNLNLLVGLSWLQDTDSRIMDMCDDNSDGDDTNGLTKFDLTLHEPEFTKLLKKSSTQLEYSYYYTKEDALLEVNKITVPKAFYNSLSPFNQKIIARIEDKISHSCVALASIIDLRVNPLPKVYLPTQSLYCVGDNQELPNIGQYLGEGVSYEWSTGEQTATITPRETGEYHVRTTYENTGCAYVSNTYKFKISSKPRGIDISTSQDIGSEGYVDIDAYGYENRGKFLYALDTRDHYQEGGRFEGVSPGIHRIYAKDDNGCGEIKESIFMPGFTNFFTPNGDGVNDRWTIDGLQEDVFEPLVSVYNRNLQLMYRFKPTRGIGWDGIVNGTPAPEDDYWFSLDYYDREGKPRNKRGHFTLKR